MRARKQLPNSYPKAFTLVELMAVISIIALLGAILFPVFSQAKKRALRSACQSNLGQIGAAFQLYAGDWDDRYPWAVDAFTRANNEAHQDYPPPFDLIPDMVTVMSPYTGGHGQVWKCPADTIPYDATWAQWGLRGTFPCIFDFAGTSYGFNARQYFGRSHTSLNETELHIGGDAGSWHCDYVDPNFYTKASNELFGDGHVKFASLNDRS